MTSHAEIERKYDVDEHAIIPRFDTLGAVGIRSSAPTEQFELDARYFDTEDGALAAHRMTLRGRSGGPDAGWHLKRPAVEGRSELHWPLTASDGDDGSSVPPEVLEPVRGIVRDHPLSLIAVIRTRRTITRLLDADGSELVEIADDTVSASDAATGTLRIWREWEAELLDGAPGTVTGRTTLLDAVESVLIDSGASVAASTSKLASALGRASLGASPMPSATSKRDAASDVLLVALQALLRQLTDLDARVRADEPDSVHQLRTRIRRVRSLLAGYRRVFDREHTEPLDAQLQHLGAVLGDARDAEVMRERAAALVDDRPELSPSVRDAFIVEFDGARSRERVLAELGATRYFRLLDALDEFVARPPLANHASDPASSVMPAALRKQQKRVLFRARQADAQANDVERITLLHSTRKAAKRLRYMAEAVSDGEAAVFGKRIRKLGSAAKAVHDALGEHRDGVLMQDYLRTSAERGDHAFDYGVAHEIERRTGEAALVEYRTALRSLRRLRPS